ncbi:MAG: hypothetical protein M3389_03765, partial [Actinomycetota bacterium]|nr:hypothetical protein [Actinomycetota bacterium]
MPRSLSRRSRRRFAVPFAMLVLAVIAVLSGPSAASAAWDPPSCVPSANAVNPVIGTQCIGRKQMRARGRIDPACLTTPAVRGEIYPSRSWCGGGGPEYIAQARIIAELGPASGGIRPETQWEVTVKRTSGSWGRADITHDDGADLHVYEVKQTSDASFPLTHVQVTGYIDALVDADTIPIARYGRGPLGLLQTAPDFFLAPEVGYPECEPREGTKAFVYRIYGSWLITNGIIAVHSKRLPCFDPKTEDVPVGVLEPEEVPIPGGGGATSAAPTGAPSGS